MYVAGRSGYLESLLDEDIDEADAHKWVAFDVSHTGWRGNVRYDKMLSIKGDEDFLWRDIGLPILIDGRKPA